MASKKVVLERLLIFVIVGIAGIVAGTLSSRHIHGIGVAEDRAQIVRECPMAQHGETLLLSVQMEDGRTYCRYAETGRFDWRKKNWKEAM
ncbi:MAG: hypothetical protein LBI35_05100 [Burkholderiales bacterium]|jgi:hypothetical protein|nr:hypothetical protein [Burkholderiales bacterium]